MGRSGAPRCDLVPMRSRHNAHCVPTRHGTLKCCGEGSYKVKSGELRGTVFGFDQIRPGLGVEAGRIWP